MTITNPSPTRAPFDQEKVRSKAVLSIDWTRGVATAITGQGATVTRAGNAFVTAGNGVLTPIGTNRPRLLHFVGANGGLLTEGARTNLALYSQQFDDAWWRKAETDITANSAIAPDGTQTADTLFALTAGAARRLRADTWPSNTGTRSIFVKRQPGSAINFLGMYNSSDNNIGAQINLTTGAVTAVDANYTVRSTPHGNGWYRFEVSTATTFGTIGWILVETNLGVSVTSTGSANGVLVWQGQIEAGSFASSPIPTVAATVTRPTDQVSYANFPQPAEIAARGGITLYWAGVDLGTQSVANARLWQVGHLSTLVRTLEVRANPTGSYRLGLGSDTVILTATATAPTSGTFGEVVSQVEHRLNGGVPEFRIRIATYQGGVLLVQSAFSAWIDATSLIAGGWNTAPTLFVGDRDGGNNPGFQLNQAFKARFGIHDLASMRTLV